jgi:hypothetical protein
MATRTHDPRVWIMEIDSMDWIHQHARTTTRGIEKGGGEEKVVESVWKSGSEILTRRGVYATPRRPAADRSLRGGLRLRPMPTAGPCTAINACCMCVWDVGSNRKAGPETGSHHVDRVAVRAIRRTQSREEEENALACRSSVRVGADERSMQEASKQAEARHQILTFGAFPIPIAT